MSDLIAQIGIAVFGSLCVYHTARGNTFRACVFGLAGEPFWVYTALANRQAGVLAMSVVYALLFLWGVKRTLTTPEGNE